MSKSGVEGYGSKGLDGFRYAHELIVQYINHLDAGAKGLLPVAYYSFLSICALTTLDSGYIALKWFPGANLGKSQNVLVGMIPKRLLDPPIPTFLLVMGITLTGLWARLELEYFMVFYASFFCGLRLAGHRPLFCAQLTATAAADPDVFAGRHFAGDIRFRLLHRREHVADFRFAPAALVCGLAGFQYRPVARGHRTGGGGH
jgi:hypothetical protein